jgi:adenosylcobinamide-phosphate synthase
VAHPLSGTAGPLAPDPAWLALAVVVDLAAGDPVYRWHPVRLIGAALTWIEARLRDIGLDGYGGGILLFIALAGVSLGVLAGLVAGAHAIAPWLAVVIHLAVLYSLLALGDLLHHVWRIERALWAGDLSLARGAVRLLVGRDTDRLDAGGCRRAAVESLSENLTDGFVSPVLWYALLGLPGLVLFKVVSTMDSMVGYRSPRYLRFGWCGARLDDVMNFVPARLTWLVITVVAVFVPGCSPRKAWHVGLTQHRLLLGPNAGWSEAAAAGALQRRIVGPIWLQGTLVTELWIGDPSDPPLESPGDVRCAMVLIVISGLAVTGMAVVGLLVARAAL